MSATGVLIVCSFTTAAAFGLYYLALRRFHQRGDLVQRTADRSATFGLA